MIHTYIITGMTCSTCAAEVQHLLSQVEGVKDVAINLSSGEAEIKMDKHIPLHLLKDAFRGNPKYNIAEKNERVDNSTKPQTQTTSWFDTYRPLLLIVTYIFFVSLLTSFHNGLLSINQWMNSFMAGFFIVFSFFKLLNLSAFAVSYAMYDVIGKRVKIYALLYPFIELALGLAYLTHFSPVFTNTATIIIMGIGSVGVIQSVINKRTIQCACLGTVFNLPMSTITIIENLAMIVMAAMALITLC